jgi:branched-chain amino acid transport system substrate-binding protein
MGVLNPGAPGLYEQDFLKTMGKYGDFLISNVPWLDPRTAMTQALEKRHAAKFPGDQLDINGGFTFEALLIAAQAWLAAKSTKADALMEALRNTKIDQHVMVGGPIQFDAKGQNVNIKAAAVENLKRKPTVVMPLDSAAAPLVFPMPGWNDKRRT